MANPDHPVEEGQYILTPYFQKKIRPYSLQMQDCSKIYALFIEKDGEKRNIELIKQLTVGFLNVFSPQVTT